MSQDHLLDGVLAHGAAWAGVVTTIAGWALDGGRLRASMLATGGALLAASGALFLLNGTLAFTDTVGPGEAADVLTGTRYGRTLAAYVAAAALAWCGAAARAQRVASAGFLAAIGALVALGHGSSQGIATPLALAHLAHVGAVCAWMAGLVALSARVADGEQPRQALIAFSRRAGPLAAVAVASGALLAARYGAAAWSPYVGALLLKMALVAGLLGAALANRRRLADLDAPRAWAALDRGMLAELAAAAAIGAIAALLSQLEPP